MKTRIYAAPAVKELTSCLPDYRLSKIFQCKSIIADTHKQGYVDVCPAGQHLKLYNTYYNYISLLSCIYLNHFEEALYLYF